MMGRETDEQGGDGRSDDALVRRNRRQRRAARYAILLVVALGIHAAIGVAAVQLAEFVGTETTESSRETVEVGVVESEPEPEPRAPERQQEDSNLPDLPEPPPDVEKPEETDREPPEPEPEPEETPPEEPPEEPDPEPEPKKEEKETAPGDSESSDAEPAPMDPVHLDGLDQKSLVEGGDGPKMKEGRGIEEGKVTDRWVDPDRLGGVETEEGADGSGRGDGEGGSGDSPRNCPEQDAKLKRKVPTESYPVAAKRRGIEGEVVAVLEISNEGEVTGVDIVEGLGHGLDELAREAFRQWQFEPAREDCRPVATKKRAVHRFTLER